MARDESVRGGDGDAPASTIGALRRGLDILDLFAVDRPQITIGEMAAALAIHKSSASRLASTLATSGYLRHGAVAGTYLLGHRLLALGAIANAGEDLHSAVLPCVEGLVAATGETGHLAVLAGIEATTVGLVEGWHTVRMYSWVGKVTPASCSSTGKSLLAALPPEVVSERFAGRELSIRTPRSIATIDALAVELERVRRLGYGIDDEELEEGLRCVSAPVFTSDGRAEASVSVSGPAQRLTRERLPELAEHVRWWAWRASLARGATSVPEGWPAPPRERPAELSWLAGGASSAQAAVGSFAAH